MGWLAFGTRLRAVAVACSPCQKAKEQARLEGLEPQTKPVLWATYTGLAGERSWTDAHWMLASDVLAARWDAPRAEAAGWPTFYRLTMFAALARVAPMEVVDARHDQVATALADGLLRVPAATQVAIMLAIKGTPLLAHPAMRHSLATLAVQGEALPRRDASALLSVDNPPLTTATHR